MPRSGYLKVIGDFTRWQDRLVFGCDDTAKSEFLNKRPAKGGIGAPGQSQSNLWFTPLDGPDRQGTALGRGSVWVDEPVKAGVLVAAGPDSVTVETGSGRLEVPYADVKKSTLMWKLVKSR